ncbi:prevent-host-death family protein [Desulfosalsimonas propionicica]|uniref:Antitoxin n=1 Tax=Desulfosalsimonas propionicica TaxID=332175 RepID=A0A7W0CBU9_9BACT|nr:type II toxin-antitoxin system prevent-host-death family antitoxin [Desulfosalsimonas propionicica]MBA2882896.1 prevent-host-death family protein [Desulfosalsimonas propionicica]
MQKINVKEARRNISRLLDEINAGEEIILLRRGKPVARMMQVENDHKEALRFPDRTLFRSKLPPMKQSSASLIRDIRDERG